MSKSGLSKARLQRLHKMADGYVASGQVVGAITLVHRRGETDVHVTGLADKARGKALKRDSIFRIASMSKPITAAAAMILVEEGRLRLDEPVDRLLPELAGLQVLRTPTSELTDTVPANRPLTLRDLLTFRLGWGMAFAPPGMQPPISKAMDERKIMGLKPFPPYSMDEWIKVLGELPLMHQPGERWMYHTGSDVLGVLIQRAAELPFEDFLKERIFSPLGMKDTGFHVPPKKIDRLASCYAINPRSGQTEIYDDGADSQWATPPSFQMGGGGLVSTVDDYLAFGRMMLNKGEVDGTRILSRVTVETMTTDQLTPEQKAVSGFFPGFWDTTGWGFGVSVDTYRSAIHKRPGRFGWDGAFGTSWAADPTEDMTCVLMQQHMGFGPAPAGIHGDFWTLAYQAIDD